MTKKHMKKKCSTSLLEKCKSKLWGITSQGSEWPSSKSLETNNAGEGVQKGDPSYTAGGDVNWQSHYREEYGGSLKNGKQSFI